MNHVYRLKRSGRTQQLQPVPETARSASKGSSSTGKTLAQAVTATLASVALGGMASLAHAQQAPPAVNQLPQGGVVTRGSANINTSTTQAGNALMTVNQASQRAVIDWASFNVGSQAKVQFNQPSSSAVTLNNILGNNASQIYGQISANGQVFLSNPNGVYFSPTAQVNVGGLVATTGQANADDFMAGKAIFNRGGSTGSVVNQGQLTSAAGGYIALLAPEVRNQGVVVAQAGTVALASGEAITLSFNNTGTGLAGITTTPQAIAALVENRSAVLAEGGQIILSAHALASLQGSVVNNSGQLSATSLTQKGGKIVLMADQIALSSTSRIDANGPQGGGTVLVGGDWQGTGDTRQATQVTMMQGASIEANATQQGDGGKVVLWSDIRSANSLTQVEGRIEAKGAGTGSGGQVETSGHTLQVGEQLVVNTQAAGQGQSGQWLLDPADIDINSTGTEAGFTNSSGTFRPNSGLSASLINPSTIQTALASGSVTITTTNTGTAGTGTGNITITSDVVWSSANSLTLIAAGGVSGAGNITTGTSASSLTFDQAGSSTYSGAIGGAGRVIKLGAGTLTLSGNNTYSGTTTISAGALAAGSNTAFGTAAITGVGTLDLNGRTLSNPVQMGSGGVAGTIVNSSSSAAELTGDVDIVGSPLNIVADYGFITLSNSNSLSLGSNLTLGGAGGGLIRQSTGNNAASIIKQGTGTWTLSPTIGTNNHRSGVTISAGVLKIGAPTALGNGPVTVASGAALDLNGQIVTNGGGTGSVSLTLNGTGVNGGGALMNSSASTASFPNGVSLTGDTTIVGGAGAITLNGNLTGNNRALTLGGAVGGTYIGIISNTTSALTKVDAGTWTLSGVNTYSAPTTVSGGTLRMGSGSANGALPSSSFSVASGATLVYNVTAAGSLSPTATFTGSGAIVNQAFGTSLNLSGATLTGFSGTYAVSVNEVPVTPTMAAMVLPANPDLSNNTLSVITTGFQPGFLPLQVITWTGSNSGSAPALLLNGASVSSGVTNLGGTVTLFTNNLTLGTGALWTLTIGSGATRYYTTAIDSSGANLTANAMANLAPGAAVTQSGAITGTGNLTVVGSGTLTLSGANTYSGTTTVNSGITLKTGSATALGIGAVTVASGGALDLAGQTLTSTGTLTLNGAGISSSGALFNSSSTGATYAGPLALGSASTINGSSGSITLSSTGSITGAGIGLTLGGASGGSLAGSLNTGTGTLTKQDAGTWTLTGNSTTTGSTTVGAGTLQVGNGGSTGALASSNVSVASGATLAYNLSNGSTGLAPTYTYSGAGTLLNLAYGSSLDLSGATPSSFTGNYAVSVNETVATPTVASIVLKNSPDLSGTTFSVSTNGYQSSFTSLPVITWGGTSSNSPALKINGLSTTSGTNAVGGTVYLNANDLSLGQGAMWSFTNSGSTTYYASNIDNTARTLSTATITVPPGVTATESGILSGTTASSATLTLNGGGVLVLSGTNTYAGNTSVNTGTTLRAANAKAFGNTSTSYAVTVDSGAVLDLAGQNMSGTGKLILNGSGINGGGALVNSSATPANYAGLVTLGSNSAIISGSGSITLSNSGTMTGAGFALTLGGAAGGTLTSVIGTGAGTLVKQDSGTWTLNGASTYTGGTTVNGGVLKAGNIAAFGGSSGGTVTVANGAAVDFNGFNLTNSMTINGTGVAGGGALFNSSATAATFGNASTSVLTLGSDSSVVGSTGSFNLNANTIAGGGYGLTLGGGAIDSGFVINSGALNDSIASLTKEGAGTWTLRTANTLKGLTTVSAGKLVVGNANAFGTGAVTVASGAYIDLYGKDVVNAGVLTLNGTGVSNSGALVNSSGTAASYSGLLRLGSATSIISSFGTITLGNTGAITGAGFGLTLDGSVGGSIAGSLETGTGTVTKQGSGTWTLSSASTPRDSTYSGGTTVSAGTLKAGSPTAFGSGDIGTSGLGKVDINGQTMTSTGGLTLNNSNATTGLTNSSATAGTFAGLLTLMTTNISVVDGGTGGITLSNTGTIVGNAKKLQLNGNGLLMSKLDTTVNTLDKAGSGTWNLSGNNTNTSTTVTSGTLKAGSATAFGLSTISVYSGGAIDLNGWTLTSTGTLYLQGTGVSSGGALMNSGVAAAYAGPVSLLAASSIVGGTGAITLSNVGNITGAGLGLTLGGAAGGSISSNITTNSGSLTKQDSGTWTLSGTNTYTGGTNINGGTLEMGSAGAVGTAGTISFGGGILRLFNTTDHSARFSTSANQAYSLDTNGQNVILASNLTSSGGTFTKLGSGTLTLSGTNTYTGATTVSAGTLAVSNAAGLGSSAAGTTVASGATLDLQNVAVGAEALTLNGGTLSVSSGTSSISGSVTLGANSTVSVTGTQLTASGAIGESSAGMGLTKTGSGTLVLSGSNTYTGTTTVSAGTLAVSNAAALGTSAGGTTVASGATLDLQNVAVGAEALTLNGGTLKTSTGTSSLAGDVALGANTTVDVGGTQLTLSGVVSGANDLGKSGTGTLVLSGTNTYTGATNINAGTLEASNASALSSGAVAVASGATLAYNVASTVAPSNTFSGAGTIANVAYGQSLDLSGATLSGFTGTYQVAVNESVSPNTVASMVLPTGLNLASNTLSVNTVGVDNNFVDTPVITWSSVNGTPTLKLNGTTVSGGQAQNSRYLDLTSSSLILKQAPIIWTMTIGSTTYSFRSTTDTLGANLTADTTINVPTGVSVTESGVLSNSGRLTITGGGSILLSGANTYTGGTFINASTLRIGSDANLGAVPGSPATNITINGGTLQGTNAAAHVTLNANRLISVGSAGATFNSTDTFYSMAVNGAISGTGPVTFTSAKDLTVGSIVLSNNSPILLKASGNITQTASSTVSTVGGNITYWSDSDANADGTITLTGGTAGANTTVSSSGASIVMGGGNGVSAAAGYARGGAAAINLGPYSRVQAGTGNVTLQGMASINGGTGVLISGAVSGADVTITGRGYDNASGGTTGLSMSGGTVTASNQANITGVGGATLSTATSNMSNRGISMSTAIIEATGNGHVLVTATGGGYLPGTSNNGLEMAGGSSDNAIRSVNGTVTINATAGPSLTTGISHAVKTTLSPAAQPGNVIFGGPSQVGAITVNADSWSLDSFTAGKFTQVQSSGPVTFNSQSASFSSGGLDLSYVAFANTLTGLTVGQAGNTSSVSMGSAFSATAGVSGYNMAGPISIYGNVYISRPLVSTGAGSNGRITLGGQVIAYTGGNVVGTELLLAGTGSSQVQLVQPGNAVGTLAGSGLAQLYLGNTTALTVGTLGSTQGLTSNSTIDLYTTQGDLTLNNNVTTTNASSGAMKLTAGKNAAVGDTTSGNLVLNGGTVSVGTGGRAMLYTGAVNNAALTTLVGSGSGHFRYGSTSTVTNYTNLILTGGLYAIYRERPTVSWSSSSDQTIVYGTTPVAPVADTQSGFVNGDQADPTTVLLVASTNAYAALNRAGGYYNVGNYVYKRTVLAQALGYLANNPRLTVTAAPLSVTANDFSKDYNGLAYTGGNGVVYSGLKAGDSVANSLTGTLGYGGTAQSAVNAGSYSITPTGLTSSNYSLNLVSGTLTVKPMPLTVAINNAARFLVEADTPGYKGALYSGWVNNESPSVLGGALTITRTGGDTAAGIYKGVLQGSGLTSNNYTIKYVSGDYTIVPADQLMVELANTSSIYASTPTYGVTSARYYRSSTRSIVDLTSSVALNGTSLTLNDGVGGNTAFTVGALSPVLSTGGKLSVGAYQLGATSIANSSANYSNTITVTGGLQVNPKDVSASVTGSVSKAYDGTTVMNGLTLAVAGTVVGDTVTAAGNAAYAAKDAGTGLSYNVNNITLSGADARNYVLTDSVSHVGSNTLTGNNGVITPVALSITANNASKTYDGTAWSGGNGVTYAGFVGGEDASVLGGALAYGGTSQGAINASAIPYSIIPSGLTSTNYTIGYTHGNLVINPAGLTAITGEVVAPSGSAISKVYDGNTTATLAPANYAIVGWAVGEGATVTKTTGTYDSPDAGIGKTVTVSLLPSDYAPTGATVLSNYTLPTSVSGAVGVITPKPVTVTNTARGSTYDAVTTYGALASGMRFTTSAMVGSDSVATVTQTASGAGVTASGVAQAGPFTVTPSSAVMGVGNSANYDFSYVDGTHTVAKANLAVTASSLTATPSASGNVYNGTAYTGTYSTNALGNDASGITVTGLATGTNAGTYTSSLQVSGAVLSNYNAPVVTNASLVVSPRPITVTADAKSRLYGDANPALTYTVAADGVGSSRGLVNGDSLSGSLSTAATVTSNVGSYTIDASALANSNYLITANNGALSVTQRPVSMAVTINGALQGPTVSKTYDGTTVATLTSANYLLTGWVGSDSATVTKTSGSYDTSTAGSGKTVTVTLSNSDYSANSGTNLANYSLPTSISGAVGQINKANATVTPNSGALTYNGGNQTVSGFTASGLVGSETASVLTGVTASTTQKNAGTYATLASGSDGNYNLTFVPGSMVINKAALTVQANNDAKFVTQADASGYAGVSYSGWVGGETATTAGLGGTLAVVRSASGPDGNTGASNALAGSYTGALTASGLTSGNYAISYLPGNYTIVPANQLLVRLAPTSGSYGGAATYSVAEAKYLNQNSNTIVDLMGNVSRSGNSFTVSDGAGGSASFTVSPVGAVTSGAGQLVAGSYQLAATGTNVVSNNFSNAMTLVGTQSVMATPVTALPQVSKVYDGTTAIAQQAVPLNGALAGDAVGAAGSGAFASKNAGSNLAYSLTGVSLSGTDAGNYYLSSSAVSGNNGSITPAALAVSFTAANKVYDGSATVSLTSTDNRFGSDVLTVLATGTFADKNVGTSKAVTVSGVSLSGPDAGNYSLGSTGSGPTASIARLSQVTWVGGATGNWFDPANWAGGAVPDLANVASVTIPAGVTVSFDNTPVAPAQAGPVSIDSLGVAGSLSQSAGTLNVGAGGVTLNTLTQTGGVLTTPGAVALTSLNQTAGTLTAGSLTVAMRNPMAIQLPVVLNPALSEGQDAYQVTVLKLPQNNEAGAVHIALRDGRGDAHIAWPAALQDWIKAAGSELSLLGAEEGVELSETRDAIRLSASPDRRFPLQLAMQAGEQRVLVRIVQRP